MAKDKKKSKKQNKVEAKPISAPLFTEEQMQHLIARAIVEAEEMRKEAQHAVIAGLLHDIAYCEEMVTREDRMNHGRRSAAIARPFLESLGLELITISEVNDDLAEMVALILSLPNLHIRRLHRSCMQKRRRY